MSKRITRYTKNLIIPVVDASVSDKWETAVLEWDIIDCEEDRSAESMCMCGKDGIRYLFEIRNRINGNTLGPIGSHCIKKFGRSDLSSEVDVQERMFKLYEALTTGQRIELNSQFFSRKLLLHLLEQDAFQPSEYNGGYGENDYQFMLDMFNSRSVSGNQQRKINAIMLNSIKPFLAKKLAGKRK